MGLAWQQGPFGKHPAGRFLLKNPPPEHILYAEPAGRRMRVELASAVVAQSDDVTLLHETDRYPIAYFPAADVDQRLLVPSVTRTHHRELGESEWWSLNIGGRAHKDIAWTHPRPPAHAATMAGLIAFVWDAMDAFYEEDEPILGHVADPYHRVDVRASKRRITVYAENELVADTRAPLAVYESGFAPRWYLPRCDIAAALEDDPQRTLCPYKGVAHYFDIATHTQRVPAAAWSYPDALPESARLNGYVSFDPHRVEMRIDGQQLLPAAHQEVIATGTDRNLTAG